MASSAYLNSSALGRFFFSYVGKVLFSLTHELGIAASALEALAVRICSENMSLLKGLESQS